MSHLPLKKVKRSFDVSFLRRVGNRTIRAKLKPNQKKIGAEFTPELTEQEECLRAQIVEKQ
jgi:hypothetical protein